jgi:hypothetical protein
MEAYRVALAAQYQKGPRFAAPPRGTRMRLPLPDNSEAALDTALDICLEGHDELAAYIRARRLDEDDRPPGAPWYWYIFIREAKDKLYRLIRGEPVASVGGRIIRDPQGFFRVQRDHFAEAIDEVNSSLLRECARNDCRRIFFAKTGRSKYCSEKCRHVVANRLLRFLEKNGFSAGVRLTRKDKAQKAALIKEWKEKHGIRDQAPQDTNEEAVMQKRADSSA